MIVRLWHGWTAAADADAYEELLREEIFVGIARRGIPGYRGIELFRRPNGDSGDTPETVEFVTLMRFDSLDAVRAFAGESYETAVVPPRARALLLRFDARSAHYEVRERSTSPAISPRTVGALLAIVLAGAGGARAQATADSTAGRGIPAGSVPPSPSTGADSSAGVLPPGQPDGTAPTSSGVQPPSAAPTAAPTPATAPPSDTILSRACAGAPPGSEAPGLLAVVFRAGTPVAERAAAARAVGGTLSGPTEYGEEYVRVPLDEGPLAAVADRLIRQAPVTRVSPAPCPASTPASAPSPAPAAAPTSPTPSTPGGIPAAPAPGDSLAPPDTSSGAAAPAP